MAFVSRLLFSLSIALTFCACSSSSRLQQSQPISGNHAMASPKAIVYRTSGNYINNVPVILDETKTTLVSYPDPVDVRNNPKPTELIKGYLLDNRGIGVNVAFTSYTYEEYAAMESVPSQEEIMAHIIDKDPLVEMWVCAPRNSYSNLVSDLTQLVKNGFKGCTKIVSK